MEVQKTIIQYRFEGTPSAKAMTSYEIKRITGVDIPSRVKRYSYISVMTLDKSCSMWLEEGDTQTTEEGDTQTTKWVWCRTWRVNWAMWLDRNDIWGGVGFRRNCRVVGSRKALEFERYGPWGSDELNGPYEYDSDDSEELYSRW